MGEWDSLADISKISPDEQLQKMRDDWDQRARENARYYVNTATMEWTDEKFFASGETTVAEQILNDTHNICQGKPPAEMRVLEIGCGGGLLSKELQGNGNRVTGIDPAADAGPAYRGFLTSSKAPATISALPEEWQSGRMRRS